jgi:hypothetical protein
MSVDKHTLQRWIAGAELRVKKTSRPFAKVPVINRIPKVAGRTREYVFVEKIDLTRARNFRAQHTSEDILAAAIELPILGRRGIGNEVGMAVASFDYTDEEGDGHSLIAVCAYTIGGVVRRKREFKHALVIPIL